MFSGLFRRPIYHGKFKMRVTFMFHVRLSTVGSKKFDIQIPQFAFDKKLYLEVCEKIKRGQNDIFISQLAHLPDACRRHRLEKSFVDNILIPWWDMLEPNLKYIDGRILSWAMFNLHSIHYCSEQSLERKLAWNKIEKLAWAAAVDVENPAYTIR